MPTSSVDRLPLRAPSWSDPTAVGSRDVRLVLVDHRSGAAHHDVLSHESLQVCIVCGRIRTKRWLRA